ncbi:hypothetical protein Patl1_08559 [Pistacia atlantica]|uniref:Uncharacterized protein n=1 Tax=Pistacia atlantica TaxID=434234 RepID=A0ACC1AHY7_9ROSI|nr:hypothetical protein Patl1_08559 [Pistacia atlantica]
MKQFVTYTRYEGCLNSRRTSGGRHLSIKSMENSDNNNGNGVATKDRRPDALGNLKVLPDELICYILENLAPRDVGRLTCVSSVMYIFCNEEPLWTGLCVRKANGLLQYKGSWKKTTLQL